MLTAKSMAIAVLGAATLVGLSAPTARATFHLWKFNQVYSDASGAVQFIEMQLPSGVDDEQFVGGHSITESAFGNTFTFPANLPSVPSPNSFMLIATPGYAALSGVPTPDYVLPGNDWFDTAGDTLTYSGGIDTLSFSSTELPIDGIMSLEHPSYGSSSLITVVNSPTNLAGDTGSVPEPASMGLAIAGVGLLLSRRRRERL